MKIRVITVVFLLVCFVLFAVVSCQKNKTFIQTHGPVPVYKNIEDAMSGNRSLAFVVLPPSKQAIVVDSIDVKHYQIYKVKLSDGSVGYINDGDYKLRKNGE